MVPDGHTLQIHPPGSMGGPAQQPGMIHDPLAAGAKAAMDAAIPLQDEQKVKTKVQPKVQTKRKAKPAEKSAKGKE